MPRVWPPDRNPFDTFALQHESTRTQWSVATFPEDDKLRNSLSECKNVSD